MVGDGLIVQKRELNRHEEDKLENYWKSQGIGPNRAGTVLIGYRLHCMDTVVLHAFRI